MVDHRRRARSAWRAGLVGTSGQRHGWLAPDSWQPAARAVLHLRGGGFDPVLPLIHRDLAGLHALPANRARAHAFACRPRPDPVFHRGRNLRHGRWTPHLAVRAPARGGGDCDHGCLARPGGCGRGPRRLPGRAVVGCWPADGRRDRQRAGDLAQPDAHARQGASPRCWSGGRFAADHAATGRSHRGERECRRVLRGARLDQQLHRGVLDVAEGGGGDHGARPCHRDR